MTADSIVRAVFGTLITIQLIRLILAVNRLDGAVTRLEDTFNEHPRVYLADPP